MIIEKKCIACGIIKDINEFSPSYRACKVCSNVKNADWKKQNPEKRRAIEFKANLKYHYGITTGDYAQFINKQQGRCAICNLTKTLVIDHNHITGLVRGLLCHSCNTGLGQFGDSVEMLNRAINYLNNSMYKNSGICSLLLETGRII